MSVKGDMGGVEESEKREGQSEKKRGILFLSDFYSKNILKNLKIVYVTNSEFFFEYKRNSFYTLYKIIQILFKKLIIISFSYKFLCALKIFEVAMITSIGAAFTSS